MRISKEPEVRRQEIIDTAMRVFSERGYEATTMKDIAREMKVASGLCYHYFPNKQELYETAVRQYARACTAGFVEIFRRTELSLDESLELLGNVWKTARTGGVFAYESFFHGKGNEIFHYQLDVAVIRELLPWVTAYLDALKARGEIGVPDTGAAARFVLYGQIGMVDDRSIPLEARIERIKELIVRTLA
ncbi:TetR/AcrR family transcriptional regulator [Enterocloster asparagiformis]|uniref:TetR/AcrR family transcriptional regulator n=1 Tax=Enterocloster asparagiformis TaxID=333367 RepID=UPI0004650623|nr:TetR/AcrR family transcriptional regulator [Enterocloster asparagiformis]